MPIPPFIPYEPCPNPGYGTTVIQAAVAHNSIGSWPGDKNYIRTNSLAHCTVGPDEGQWAWHAPTEVLLPHCNGANRRAFGVEFSGGAGGPLTPWQQQAWKQIVAWAVDIGVPSQYLDPESVPNASVWVNGGGFSGWISHRNVRTDDGTYQHTDFVPLTDWQAAPEPPPDTTFAEFVAACQKDDDDMDKFAEVTLTDGRTVTVIRGQDSGVYYRILGVDGNYESAWLQVPGAVRFTPTLLAWKAGVCRMKAVGTDWGAYEAVLTEGAHTFGPLVPMGGAVAGLGAY